MQTSFDDRRKKSADYNEFKEVTGKKYTGMKVGRGHKWYYDKGEWKEKKVAPDKWEFSYNVTKQTHTEDKTRTIVVHKTRTLNFNIHLLDL